MYRTVEDGRALLKAAQEIHAERHGAQTFTPGTHLPLEAAGERIGISPKRLRYYDAVQDLEYEGAIEWDERARYARGDKHYVITQRGLDGAGYGKGRAVQWVPQGSNQEVEREGGLGCQIEIVVEVQSCEQNGSGGGGARTA
jgi:hypothetical protein